jgi:hypothetical protein
MSDTWQRAEVVGPVSGMRGEAQNKVDLLFMQLEILLSDSIHYCVMLASTLLQIL